MPSYTHNTAPTQFVEAAGIRFADSQAAGRAYLERIRAREDRAVGVSMETANAHLLAAGDWSQPDRHGYAYLKGITQPTLVVNNSNDIVIATVNSFILQQHHPDAQLIPYPDSNHGSQFQYPQLFVRQVRLFLDETSVL